MFSALSDFFSLVFKILLFSSFYYELALLHLRFSPSNFSVIAFVFFALFLCLCCGRDFRSVVSHLKAFNQLGSERIILTFFFLYSTAAVVAVDPIHLDFIRRCLCFFFNFIFESMFNFFRMCILNGSFYSVSNEFQFGCRQMY